MFLKYVFRRNIMWGSVIEVWGKKDVDSSVNKPYSIDNESAYLDAIIQKIDIEINNLHELKDYLIHIKGCFSKSQELRKKVKQLNLRK